MNELIKANHSGGETRIAMIRRQSDALTAGSVTLDDLGKELGLTREQVAFASAYASADGVGSNGRQAAILAYGYMDDTAGRALARTTAHKNLKHPQVCMLIGILLDTTGLNNEFVDKRLMEIIEQRNDNRTAILAISEYNKVQNRIKQTVEIVEHKAFDFSGLSAEEIKAWLEITEKARLTQGQHNNLKVLSNG